MEQLIEQFFAPFFDGLTIRPLTKALVTRLLLDLPLSPATAVDFGVASDDHYRALKAVLKTDKESDDAILQDMRDRVMALETAMGKGEKLNALVQKYAPHYVNIVHFRTDWDEVDTLYAMMPDENDPSEPA